MGILDHVAEQIKQLRAHYTRTTVAAKGSLKKRWPNTSRSPPILYSGGITGMYRHRDLGVSYSDQSNITRTLEIGAEIFAAEFIFPDRDFMAQLNNSGIETWLVSTSRSTAARS